MACNPRTEQYDPSPDLVDDVDFGNVLKPEDVAKVWRLRLRRTINAELVRQASANKKGARAEVEVVDFPEKVVLQVMHDYRVRGWSVTPYSKTIVLEADFSKALP